jgi:ABC-type uncharacterized transport system substrate-binding protein
MAAYSALATVSDAASGSNFPSGDSDHAPYRNGRRQRVARVFRRLRRLGYVEGQNLIIERYSAEGHHERYADLAREIVARNPDVIVTGTNPVVTTVKATTSTIPVVAFMIDPLQARLVTSLGRPGGNLTGITLDAGIENWGKRLEILKEAIPSAAKVAFLGMREGWEGSSGQVLRDLAAQMGISLAFTLPSYSDRRPGARWSEREATTAPTLSARGYAF